MSINKAKLLIDERDELREKAKEHYSKSNISTGQEFSAKARERDNELKKLLSNKRTKPNTIDRLKMEIELNS